MDAYELGVLLHSNDNLRVRVFAATSLKRAGVLFIKQYTCSQYAEADFLLKEAVAQAHQPFPLWAALVEVVMAQEQKSEDFTVNFVFEKFVQELPRELVVRNERKTGVEPGLSAYETVSVIYERTETLVCVQEGRDKHTGGEVVVKTYGPYRFAHEANAVLLEAIVQAHVVHEFNTNLIDIAVCAERTVYFKLSLVMEKLSKDVQTDIEERKREHRSYTEAELLTFLLHVTSGLMQAKLKPANIFLSLDGKFKVGDFGNAWVKSQLSPSQVSASPAAGNSLERQLETLTISAAGTPLYLSPEMRSSMTGLDVRVDSFASDIYALGVTVLHLASLEGPSSLNTFDMNMLRERIPQEVGALRYSDDVKTMVMRMLCVEPDMRQIVEELNMVVAVLLGRDIQLCEEGDWNNMTPSQLCIHENKFKFALKMMEKHPAKVENKLTIYSMLSRIYRVQHKLQLSEEYALKCLTQTRQIHGEDNFSVAMIYCNLSNIYIDMGRVSESESFSLKALRILERLHKENTIEAACANCNLALVYKGLKRLPEAEQYALKGLSLRQRLLGENHTETSIAYSNLSQIYKDMERLEDAERYGLKCLEIAMRLHGENHTWTAQIFNNLATIYQDMKRYRESEDFGLKAVRIRTALLGQVHPDTQNAIHNLAYLYLKANNPQEAEKYAMVSLSLTHQLFGERHPYTSDAYSLLNQIYIEMEDIQNALKYGEKWLTTARLIYQDGNPEIEQAMENVSMLRMMTGMVGLIKGISANTAAKKPAKAKDGHRKKKR